MSDPTAPAEVATYPLYGGARGIAVGGNLAVVAAGENGLRILNASNPAAPVEIGAYAQLSDASGVLLVGDQVYVTDGQAGGLRIIGISNPAYSALVGGVDTPGAAVRVAVAGDYAYVADRARGLRIIDISIPDHPTEITFYDTPGSVGDVAVISNYAYVADGAGGLAILRGLNEVATQTIPPTGGSLASSSGDTGFQFPSGSFTEPVKITYRRLLGDQDIGDKTGIGHTFDLSAVFAGSGQPADPQQPYTVTVHYTADQTAGVLESSLALHYWNGLQWVMEPTSGVDTLSNVISALPNHFSLWSILGEKPPPTPTATPTSTITNTPPPTATPTCTATPAALVRLPLMRK